MGSHKWRASAMFLLLMACVACVAGCGGADVTALNSPLVAQISGPMPVYDCADDAARPAARLLVRPQDGIAGQYIVAVLDSVVDVQGLADKLSFRYGATLTYVWTSGLRGFALALEDSKALALAQESGVCFVEQQQVVGF